MQNMFKHNNYKDLAEADLTISFLFMHMEGPTPALRPGRENAYYSLFGQKLFVSANWLLYCNQFSAKQTFAFPGGEGLDGDTKCIFIGGF